MSVFSKRYVGYGAVMLSAFFFALISQLTKIAYNNGMTPLQLLTLQSGTAALILLGYTALFNRAALRVPAGMILKLLAHGLLGSLATNVLYAVALLYLPASMGTMLLFTYPILVTLGAFVFFHEKVKATQILALAVAVAGTMLSTQFWQISRESLEFKGILLGLGSAVAYSFFNLYGEHILNKIEPLTSLTYIQMFSALSLVLYQLPVFLSGQAVLVSNSTQFVIGVSLGTVASIVPFWLLLIGIKHIGSSKASIIGTLELPAVFVLSSVFLHEQLSAWQVAGAILILFSIVMIRLGDFKAIDKYRI
jgi:drug/metabolite transporter, DME family